MMAACKLGHYNEGTSDGGILEENHVVCEWLDVLCASLCVEVLSITTEIMTLLLHLKICWVDVHSTENISSSLKNQS